MLKKDVQVGKIYLAKVSNKLVHVKILRDNYKGWIAQNLSTGREVRILSAAKLRKEIQNISENNE